MRWYVISPKYDYTEWVCEYGGPTYEISDVVEVDGPTTAREAIIQGVRLMDEWPTIARGDGRNPHSGCQAVAICPACESEQEDGRDNWECPVCGEWWRSNLRPNGTWEYFESGQRYTTRERNARIRRFVSEHPDDPA